MTPMERSGVVAERDEIEAILNLRSSYFKTEYLFWQAKALVSNDCHDAG